MKKRVLFVFIITIICCFSSIVVKAATLTNEQVEGAISWAHGRKNAGDTSYSGYCLKFVSDAWYSQGVGNNGYAYATLAGDAMITNTDWNPPRGAVVFWDWYGTIDGIYRNWGHVGIALGDGTAIHADYNGIRVTNLYIDASRTYRGWGVWAGNSLSTDTQAPTVSNYRVSNINTNTITITADLNDNVGVTRVWLNIYGPGGSNGYSVSASNGTFSHTINTSDYGGEGNYSIHLYAFDAAGNETGAALNNIYFSSDNQAPTINSLTLKEVSKNTFTISADLTDNVGVTRVWLNVYGPNGQNGYEVNASNGTFTHTINMSDYGGFGEYSIHLYAFDKAGNETRKALNHFYIKSNENIFIGVTQTDTSYEINTQISNLSQSAIYTVAMYTADGELIDAKTQSLDNGATLASASLTKNDRASYIKVYLWDSLNSMKPLVECEKIAL